MSDFIPTSGVPFSTANGHLTVPLDDSRASDVPFVFEEQMKRKRGLGATGGSIVAHAAFFAFLIAMAKWGPTPSAMPLFDTVPNQQIIWLEQPGPGGGGGGGGNQMKAPPRKAELPGKEKLAVPVQKPAKVENPKPPKEEPPKPDFDLNIPAKLMASGATTIPGLIETSNPGLPESLGVGTGGGAGTGRGSGIGPGTGSGLGPGSGGGTGGGVYRPGNGVELPKVRKEVRPNYTADAMRAKVQGAVLVECVVNPDGTVGDVQIIRSLDSTFGLDQEAIKAAKQWLFTPGTRFGQPVPVIVTIELTFTLR
jgi:periplasmic protein TonB